MEPNNGELFRNSSFQEYPMAGNYYRRAPPDAAIFSAANHHGEPDTAYGNSTIWAVGNQPSGVGFIPTLNHYHHNYDFPAAGDQINTNNLAVANGIHGGPRYSDDLLESKFSRLGLMSPISLPSFASAPSYDGGSNSSVYRNYSMFNGSDTNSVSSEWRDVQRTWTQSAARGRMGVRVQPYTNSGFEFVNSNGNSSYWKPNLYNYERDYSNDYNINGPQSYDLGVGSFLNSSRHNGNGNSSYRYCNSSICRPKRWDLTSLKDLTGKIFMMSKDQQGCRFLQAKFLEGSEEEIQIIINEVKDHICELMVDQFGNYLVHKVFAACNQEEISEFLVFVTSDEEGFKDICVDSHGSRSVQKLLEFLTTQEQRSRAVSVLRRITLPLTQSMNGHHVIEYCLNNFSVEENKQILNEVADNLMKIALDKSGCCVLQQCVERATGEPRDRLIAEITSNSLHLCEHSFGNYVVQYIVGLKIPRATEEIMAQLTGSFVSISMSKYGSNVVEKFLKDDADDCHVVPIVEEIICSPDFLRLLQDPFGNYVAQSAFLASKGALRSALTSRIEACYPHLHSHPHGKRVLSRIRGSKSRV